MDSSKKTTKTRKKGKSTIIPHESNSFQKQWMFSPIDQKVVSVNPPTIMAVRDKNGVSEITAAKSEVAIDRSEAFQAVMQERYPYYLQWSPMAMRDEDGKKDYIIGMCSAPFVVRRHLETIDEWREELTRMVATKEIEVYNPLDIDIMGCTMQLIVYQPRLLQAVDAMISRIKKKENVHFLETLYPPQVLIEGMNGGDSDD